MRARCRAHCAVPSGAPWLAARRSEGWGLCVELRGKNSVCPLPPSSNEVTACLPARILVAVPFGALAEQGREGTGQGGGALCSAGHPVPGQYCVSPGSARKALGTGPPPARPALRVPSAPRRPGLVPGSLFWGWGLRRVWLLGPRPESGGRGRGAPGAWALRARVKTAFPESAADSTFRPGSRWGGAENPGEPVGGARAGGQGHPDLVSVSQEPRENGPSVWVLQAA